VAVVGAVGCVGGGGDGADDGGFCLGFRKGGRKFFCKEKS